MRNLSDVDVLLMTHSADNMRGALPLEESWLRVNGFPPPWGWSNQQTHQPESTDLLEPRHIPVKWQFLSPYPD